MLTTVMSARPLRDFLYRGREEIRKVPEQEGVEALIQLIKDDGRWVEPA